MPSSSFKSIQSASSDRHIAHSESTSKEIHKGAFKAIVGNSVFTAHVRQLLKCTRMFYERKILDTRMFYKR